MSYCTDSINSITYHTCLFSLPFQKSVAEAKKALNDQKEILKGRNVDIQTKVGERQALCKEDQEIQLKIKEMEHEISKFQRDSKDASNKVSMLYRNVPW